MTKFIDEVFYVDDSPDDRLFTSLCHTRGSYLFDLILFSDGASAVAEIDRRRASGGFMPAVLVVDHYMPGMDGPDILRLIRANPEFDAMILAVCSGGNDAFDRGIAVEAGAQVILDKPLDLDRCRALLEGRRDR